MMLSGFIEWLNENSGLFSLIFSLIVAVSTVFYACLTRSLVEETRKMREVQTEPKVYVIIQPGKDWINFLDMSIENVGLGPAFNITFKVDPDFEYIKGEMLSNLGIIKNGISYLAPSQKMNFFFTSMVEDFKRKIADSFEIKVTYKNSIGKEYTDSFLINFSYLIGLTQATDPTYNMLGNIKSIKDSIVKYTDMFTREYAQQEVKKMIELKNKNTISKNNKIKK